MSSGMGRKDFYSRDRNWESYRRYEKPRSMKRSHSPLRDKRSRSPHRNKKDIDDNLLNDKPKHDVWDNHRQDFSIPPPPPTFSTQDGPAYNQTYQPSYSGIYDEFSSGPPPANNDMSSWNQMSLPPPPAPQVYNVEDQIKKEAAIESEMRHQKAALSKQREDYIKKASILKKELDTLKDQRSELRGDSKRSPSPDTKRFLKENTKLQLEIQNKLKTINNVVDMLNGIIGEEAADINDSDGTPERSSKRKSRSPSVGKSNYVYYDPEMHWCRVCNEFPPTAKDYLNHLHSAAHHKSAAAHMEAPWHSLAGMNEGFPNYPSAPTKRTPIKGLQFFVPSTAWYCKLCDQFIGDLHCASAHLKSVVHAKNYTNFVEQNPHWETDWMSDRQKAFEKSRDTKKSKEEKGQYTAHTITFSKDGFHTKNKTPEREVDKKRKDKKKKKNRKRSSSRSSSSQTSSSESDSEPAKKKKSNRKEKEKSKDRREPRGKWMTSLNEERLHDSDIKIIDNMKSRIKMDDMEAISRRGGERNARERERSTPREGERERHAMRRSHSREDRRPIESHRREDRHGDRREERRDDRRDERNESRREERHEERRENKREERRDDKRERRDDRRNSPAREIKKPEIRKMPFIGKMPVYKHLGKSKTEEVKKEDEKKRDDEAIRKKQQEMDIEIQKKVAEFKEKIAKSQMERSQAEAQQQLMSGLLNPYLVGAPPAPPVAPHAPVISMTTPTPQIAPTTHQGQPPNLPKDFQDALDIIFPSEVKPDMKQQELFQGLNQQIPGFAGMGMVPQFQQIGLLGQTPMMVPFEMNASMYPRQQLYDTHVPILPANQTNDNRLKNQEASKNNDGEKKMERNKEELDELAMLGIDASDVGAGM